MKENEWWLDGPFEPIINFEVEEEDVSEDLYDQFMEKQERSFNECFN